MPAGFRSAFSSSAAGISTPAFCAPRAGSPAGSSRKPKDAAARFFSDSTSARSCSTSLRSENAMTQWVRRPSALPTVPSATSTWRRSPSFVQPPRSRRLDKQLPGARVAICEADVTNPTLGGMARLRRQRIAVAPHALQILDFDRAPQKTHVAVDLRLIRIRAVEMRRTEAIPSAELHIDARARHVLVEAGRLDDQVIRGRVADNLAPIRQRAAPDASK